MSRIQQPSMEQIAAMSSMQQQQEIMQYKAEFRGMAGGLFREVAAVHLESADEDEDAEFFERLSIRCMNAARAYHAAFGIWHGDDAERNIADVKEKLAAQKAEQAKPQKGKIATE